jgi:L-asparaginase
MTTPLERAAFARAAASGVVIVQATRAASGRVAPRRHLRDEGIVAADDLSPQKARILLALGLLRTKSVAELQRMFHTY